MQSHSKNHHPTQNQNQRDKETQNEKQKQKNEHGIEPPLQTKVFSDNKEDQNNSNETNGMRPINHKDGAPFSLNCDFLQAVKAMRTRSRFSSDRFRSCYILPFCGGV